MYCNVLERVVLIVFGSWRDEVKEKSEQGETFAMNGSLSVRLPGSACLLPVLQQIDGDWDDCTWTELG